MKHQSIPVSRSYFRAKHPSIILLALSLQLCVQSITGQQLIKTGDGQARLYVQEMTNHTIRVSITPANGPAAITLKKDLVLEEKWQVDPLKGVLLKQGVKHAFSKIDVRLNEQEQTLDFFDKKGKRFQQLIFSGKQGRLGFYTGTAPLLGLGGGGQQFDRRGTYDEMQAGVPANEMQLYGSRLPIPLLIGTEGWSLFFHLPYRAAIDLRKGTTGYFIPRTNTTIPEEQALPLDVFVSLNETPATAMKEYAALVGRVPLPPKWTFGYMQSHRSLGTPASIVAEADSFRQRKLPIDAMIYLGTGYAPNGWNMGHASMDFNPGSFNQPKKIIDQLHEQHVKVVLHVNNAPRNLYGTMRPSVTDTGRNYAYNYWQWHLPVYEQPIDGWWPDDGDELPIPARLTRHMIYAEGPLLTRPGKRYFSMQRTGYAGMQRYGTFGWSGDVFSIWSSLAAHVQLGLNYSMTASPYWGSDIGGFVATPEFTGELYARWFQFATFTPLFRSHGRIWGNHRPWGWSYGTLYPSYEVSWATPGAGVPDSSALLNPAIEPICKKFLELRYQLLPYNYTIARENHDSSLPLMRPLWMHYPDDAEAVSQKDEYLWGRHILVAPVTEKNATSRKLYLPDGIWYDFWSQRKYQGQQHINRYVELSTMPLFVQAGTILPLDPVRQYTAELVTAPTTLRIYTGADGSFTLYDDDGESTSYLTNNGSRIRCTWNDQARTLTLAPAGGQQTARRFNIELVGVQRMQAGTTKHIDYRGESITLQLFSE